MKFGIISLIGRPSSGKSTILNAMCKQKVSITSPVPQTTRNMIRGILNLPEGQIIIQDTPGLNCSEKKINSCLKNLIYKSLQGTDVIVYVIDPTRAPGAEEQAIMALLKKQHNTPILAVFNKADLPCPHLSEYRTLIQNTVEITGLSEISALHNTGIDNLIDELISICPEGKPMYPDDVYTDQDASFRMAEIIREQAIARTSDELPHSIYVEIADLEQTDNGVWVRAFITVEKSSQVGIVVGHQGQKIKAIRIACLKAMKKIFPWKISLDLRVKVHHKWQKKVSLLKQLTDGRY